MFWNNFASLCAKANKSTTAVIIELGLARGSVTYWKKGATPNNATLCKIANYFSVTVEELTADEKQNAPTPTRNECEEKMLEHFRGLLPEEQEALIKVAESMKKSSDKAQ